MTFIFHFDDVIIVKFSIKGDNAEFFIFACYINRRWLFLKTWICMTMFFYHYLGCYSTVFSQILVCCSWDSGLSVMCLWYLIRCREHGQIFNSKCHLKILIDEFLVTCYPYERSEKSHKQKSHKQFLYKIYLKNGPYNHLQIFSVSLASSGIVDLLFSVWSLNHDVIQAPFCVVTLSFISS